jgi:hypothetical protein
VGQRRDLLRFRINTANEHAIHLHDVLRVRWDSLVECERRESCAFVLINTGDERLSTGQSGIHHRLSPDQGKNSLLWQPCLTLTSRCYSQTPLHYLPPVFPDHSLPIQTHCLPSRTFESQKHPLSACKTIRPTPSNSHSLVMQP